MIEETSRITDRNEPASVPEQVDPSGPGGNRLLSSPAASHVIPASGQRFADRYAERPLKVGYIVKMFPRFSETFIVNEILELEHLGVKITIFSLKQPDESTVQPQVARVRARVHVVPPVLRGFLSRHLIPHLICLCRAPIRYVKTLHFVAGRGTKAAWHKFIGAPYIVQQARAAGIEHFHAHFASGPARQAKLASMLSGIPFSFTAHAKDLFWDGHQHGKNKKLKKRVRMASFVVTISDYNQRFIRDLGFKILRKHLVTIHNGLDLHQWQWTRPDGRPLSTNGTREPQILAVGRLVPKKGFDTLIEACRIIEANGRPFRCTIVGAGPERGALAARIRELGLRHRVVLAGPIAQDRLHTELYPQATVLAQPSIRSADGDQDGIPTVLVEALAMGLPVVTTPVSGIGEIVRDGETGLLTPPGDAQALAAAMLRLIDEDELVAGLARNGRWLIERRFNLRNNAKVLIHLIETSARGRTRWSIGKLRYRAGLEPFAGDEDRGGDDDPTRQESGDTRGVLEP